MKADLSRILPVIPLKKTSLFPGFSLPIRVGRAASIEAVKRSQESFGGWILAVSQLDDAEEPTISQLPRIGILARLEKVKGSDGHGYQMLIRAEKRVRIRDFIKNDRLITALAEEYPDIHDIDAKTEQALLESVKKIAEEILELVPANTEQLIELVRSIDDLAYLTHLCGINMELEVAEKQNLLELASIKSRTLKLLDLMTRQRDELQVRTEIRDKLSNKLGKGQREAILREQLKTIREELGEGEDATETKDNYRKKIENAGMPADVKKTALDELKRLESIGNASPESHVIRNYLDLLCAMPWSKSAEADLASLNLGEARSVLDQEHYGLEKIKKRILQHLAVMKLKKTAKGSILLFVGPPGVGKTSLGQSIAKAMGRKFVRGSLGGVRDDSEIRGHRRTYVGAMPGRIIQGLKRAGENNPVFMLDEIDKLGRGYSGDPAAALLEVLDPEQNATFLDHYLDVPFDLSKVFFIATANSLETIPGPLLDRMEIIDLSGYTTAEKMHIAKSHLIPKALEEFGLTTQQLEIADEALLRVITHYTREAGVRDLQRKIATIARGSAEKVISSEGLVRVELSDLEELLGAERFLHEVAERIVPPGVVTGLAWTPQGGDILFIEAQAMPGKGQLTLTGQLGDVMKESAQIALSLVRSRLAPIIPGFDFDKKDVHIHVPAGAIPKDGPSAGVTMLTTIASLFAERSVDPKLAMTGEITLRGAVTPVGGIKEKVIAAHRAGIERVILCRRNERDLKDVPEEVRSQLKFEIVDRIEDVLRIALGIELPSTPGLTSDPMAGVEKNKGLGGSASKSFIATNAASVCGGEVGRP